MYSKEMKLVVAILLLVNISLCKATPLLQDSLEDLFEKEAATSDESHDIHINHNNIDEELEKGIVTRSKKEGKWACAKKLDGKCVKWVRVGFWFSK